VADTDLVWEKSTAGWLVDKPAEQSDRLFRVILLINIYM